MKFLSKIKKSLYILGIAVLVIALLEVHLRYSNFNARHKGFEKIIEIDTALKNWANNEEMYERTTNNLFYILSPNKEYNINSDRYRGKRLTVEKKQDTYRILVLGDSTAFGVGVHYKQTFGEILVQLIKNNSGKKAECINTGVPSYTSLQGLRLFDKKFKKYEPDLILTYFGNNDAWSILPRSDKELKILPRAMIKSYGILTRLKTFNYLQYLYINRIGKFVKLKQRVNKRDFEKNLLRIKEIGEYFGARTYFITATILNDEPKLAKYIKRNMHIKSEYSIDLVQGFLDGGYALEELFLDDCHPSAKGHLIIAKIIYDRLIRDGIIDSH